jgi:hypothetical protein
MAITKRSCKYRELLQTGNNWRVAEEARADVKALTA